MELLICLISTSHHERASRGQPIVRGWNPARSALGVQCVVVGTVDPLQNNTVEFLRNEIRQPYGR